MFGMLVSCSFDKPAFISFVFSDFTKNDIVQNYLYDRYLIDYENKLELNEGFKAIMYKNQFETFDSRLRKIFNNGLRDLQNGRDENLSQYGIVCKMNIKVKMYNGKLNAIVRECEPVPHSQISSIASPSQCEHLRLFYQRAFKRIGESAISRYFEEYRRFFPIHRNGSHLAKLRFDEVKHEPKKSPTTPARRTHTRPECRRVLLRCKVHRYILSPGLLGSPPAPTANTQEQHIIQLRGPYRRHRVPRIWSLLPYHEWAPTFTNPRLGPGASVATTHHYLQELCLFFQPLKRLLTASASWGKIYAIGTISRPFI